MKQIGVCVRIGVVRYPIIDASGFDLIGFRHGSNQAYKAYTGALKRLPTKIVWLLSRGCG